MNEGNFRFNRSTGAPEILNVHQSTGRQEAVSKVYPPTRTLTPETFSHEVVAEDRSFDALKNLGKKYGTRILILAGVAALAVVAVEVSHDQAMINSTSSETSK